MNDEVLILEPLNEEKVDTGYQPNFSLSSKEEQNRELQAWGADILSKADDEGYVTMPYPTMLCGLAKILGYDQLFLNEDPWRVRDALFRAGLGCAPDSMLERFSLKGRDNVVIYKAEQEVPAVKTRQYKKALLMVKFITLMLPELDAKELAKAGTLIDEWIKTPRYRKHLRAVMRWYNQRRRLLDARTKRIFRTIMGPDDMKHLSQQLLTMAAGRGAALDAKSVYQLDRLLVMCGHAEGEVHSLLHRIQCGALALQEHYGGTEALAPVWDMKNLEVIERETAAVQNLLSEVFTGANEIPSPSSTPSSSCPPSSSCESSSSCTKPIPTSLETEILSQPQWQLSELEGLCSERGKKMSVILEEINDHAMDVVGDTVIDIDGDMAYVTTEYAQQLLKQE